MATSGNFIALKGETCTLQKIRGVKVLEDEHGVDILKMVKKVMSKNSNVDLDLSIINMLTRLDQLEKFVKNMPVSGSGTPGAPGPRGPAGEDGPTGEQGVQGPRGKDGARTIGELKDVCLDGLDDGMVLMYSEKDKKWVVGN
jgi:hypothetical protein